MKAILFFRIAAVLIVLFAAGHTFGFRQIDPSWGIADAIYTLRSVRFPVQGFHKTYWDFYTGFGLFVSLFFLFTAFVVWQVGSVSVIHWAAVKWIAWAATVCFGLVIVLSLRYFFAAPVIFSAVIFLCLLAGSLMASRASQSAHD